MGVVYVVYCGEGGMGGGTGVNYMLVRVYDIYLFGLGVIRG